MSGKPVVIVLASVVLSWTAMSCTYDQTATLAMNKDSQKQFVNSHGMKMVLIEARPFDAWTPSFADYEKAVTEISGGLERPPVSHRVELPGDFYLAEFPVTNKMYHEFIQETGHREPGGEFFDMDRNKIGDVATWKPASTDQGVVASDLEDFGHDDQPVAGLNYHDAVAFCEWLSKKEGRTYRLPEVYEWEYACRAGTDTLFWWGDRPDPRYMNYAAARIGHPSSVGLYPPNPWGLYDMHGNVAECCEQIGRPGGVQKGGAWNYPGGLTGADVYVDVRGTFTPHMPITRRTMGTGFRLACDAGQGAAREGDLASPTIRPAGGKGPQIPKLDITVGPEMDFGTVPGGGLSFLATRSGRWILNGRRSDDRGKSWQPCAALTFNALQLRDGTIIQARGPGDLRDGEGTVTVWVSTDDWETVETFTAPIHVPLGKRYFPDGDLLELDDGSLLMGLYGWMDGDQVREDNPLFPIADEAYRTRVIVARSTDRGRSWHYLSTVCNHPEMGREGANETTLIKLPTGDILAAMRTGLHGYLDKRGRESLDEPLLVTWSRCNGAKWAEPTRIYVKDKLITGIWPRSVLTAEGVLVVLRGRPYGSVVCSPDGSGTIWSDEVRYEYKGNGSGMDAMDLIDPHTVLVTYIDHYDWKTTSESRVIGLPITVRRINGK